MRDPRLAELDKLIAEETYYAALQRRRQRRARWDSAITRRETRRKLYLMEAGRLDNHDSEQLRAEASAASE